MFDFIIFKVNWEVNCFSTQYFLFFIIETNRTNGCTYIRTGGKENKTFQSLKLNFLFLELVKVFKGGVFIYPSVLKNLI